MSENTAKAEIKHTYIMEPSLWEMSGIYHDVNNNKYPQKGQVVVSHQSDLWTLEGQLTITTHETQDINYRYEIQPPPDETATFVEWKSETGGPEPVFGLFVIVEDTIMSPWQSQSGTYWGQEIFTYINPNEYQGRGFAFLQNEKVAAWSIFLTRIG